MVTIEDLYKENIKVTGGNILAIKLIEEMSELTQMLCKALDGDIRFPNLAEEMADVEIMLTQVELMLMGMHPEFRREKEKVKHGKIQRQIQRIDSLSTMRKRDGETGETETLLSKL